VQLDVLGTTKTLKTIVSALLAFQKDMENNAAAAFAPALSAAREYKLEAGCLAWVNEGGCIWTEGHPDEQTYCPESTAPEGV
jgi:hypothetical protein